MADTREILLRLKQRVRRERSLYVRLRNETNDPMQRERAFGEANVCDMIIGYINEELTQLKGETR